MKALRTEDLRNVRQAKQAASPEGPYTVEQLVNELQARDALIGQLVQSFAALNLTVTELKGGGTNG